MTSAAARADFINAEVLPMEEMLWQSRRGADLTEDARESSRRRSIELREEIKAGVNKAGLWAPHLPKEYGGMGLDFLSLAYMYEILAYAVGASPCSASLHPIRETPASS